MVDTNPDPNEPPKRSKLRAAVFGAIVALSTVVAAAALVLGPLGAPYAGDRPLAVVAIPVLIAVATGAAIFWIVLQARRK